MYNLIDLVISIWFILALATKKASEKTTVNNVPGESVPIVKIEGNEKKRNKKGEEKGFKEKQIKIRMNG